MQISGGTECKGSIKATRQRVCGMFNEPKEAGLAEAEWLWGENEVRESCLAGMDQRGD